MGGSRPPYEGLCEEDQDPRAITPVKKIKTIEPLTSAKNIVTIPIESVSASIVIPVGSICDRVSIPRESIPVESIKNSTRHNMINNSAYYLALNVFIS